MGFASIKISPRVLKLAIERANKRPAMFAREIGIEPQSIWRYLKDAESVGIDPEVFQAMVNVLQINPDELKVNGADDPKLAVLKQMAAMAWVGGLSIDDVISYFRQLKVEPHPKLVRGSDASVGRQAASMSPAAQRKSDEKDKRKRR